MRIPFKILSFILPLFLGVTSSRGDDSVIRVLSYNIHHGEGLDGKTDLKRIAKIIKSSNPDLVSLQEVDRGTKRTNRVDQAKELEKLTGMKSLFGSSMGYQGGQYGNAILTNWEVRKREIFPLPGEPRSALCVTLEDPNKDSSLGDILFIATHLDTAKEPRLASVPLIRKIIETNPEQPAILAGDLNARPGSPTMLTLQKDWLNATSAEGLLTSPANQPRSQIDYILVHPAKTWKTVEAKVIEEPVASDHRPILATIRVR